MRIALTTLACVFLLQLYSFSQPRTITGTVKDVKNVPVPFATIHLKGTSTSTSTDEKGDFRIEVSGAKPVLEISSAGFSQQEVKISTSNNYQVTLQQGGNLSEVVVTALGISRKERSIGYSTQQIGGDNLTITKEQNVLGSLAGKIAGVQFSGTSAASLGGTQKIQLRGVNTVTGDGEPLVVVDGTPISNQNFAGRNGRDYGNISQDINPDDVETINVLKGPAAAALYGLRGQFGVIMITTKKGNKNRKPTVNFSSTFTVDKAGNFMPLQNIYGAGSSLKFSTIEINGVDTKYVDGTWDESWGAKMDGTLVRHEYSFYPADPDFGKATPFVPQPNNIKDYFETGYNWNNNISFSAGGENTSFRLSYNNTTVKGIEPNTNMRRNNLSLNGSINVLHNLSISASINYANNNAQRPSYGYQALGSRNMNQWFQRNLDMNKLKQYKYSDGTFYHWNVNDPNSKGVYEDQTPIDWNNPYFDAYENVAHDSRDRIFGNIGVNYTIIPGLQVSGFIRQDGYTQNIDKRNAEGGRGTPMFGIGKYENKETNYEFLAQYNKEFGRLTLGANLGGNILQQKYTYLYEETVGGLATPGFYNISNSLERPNVENYTRKKEVRSAYGSLSLGYDNTYFIDATLRRDISSALPPANNDYLYPSVSASVVFSELLNWQPLSYGKLRLSFAQAGADLSPYKTNPYFEIGNPYNGNFPEHVPDTLNNPNLEPSLGTAYEAGLDLRFFGDRLGLSATYYHQENKKAILDLKVSGSSGYQDYYINAGNIQNKGLELSLNAIPVKTKSASWSTVINYAYNKSKVLELYPGLNDLLLDQNTYARVSMYLYARVGEPFGTIVGNAYQRDPKTGKILLDANNNPMYQTNQTLGHATPKFTGGWTNTITWRNIDLSAVIDFQGGGNFISWTRMLGTKSGQTAETAAMNDKGHNVREPLADGGGVKINGISASSGQEVTTYLAARAYYRNLLGTKIYEAWTYDASYIRMREMRLGYTFNKTDYQKLPFRSINVALLARNPFMIWQKAPKGVNPAELATGASTLNWLETGQLATVRSYGVNLSVNF